MLDRSVHWSWLLPIAIAIGGGCATRPSVVDTAAAPPTMPTPRGAVFGSLVLDAQATEEVPQWVFERNDRILGRPSPAIVLDEVSVIDSRQRLRITSNGRPYENTLVRIRSRQYRGG